jgi:hypothetical protein
MSTVIFRHEHNSTFKDKNGHNHTIKETLIDGQKGLSFSFLKKDGDKGFYRIKVIEDEANPGSFSVSEKKGEKVTDSVIQMADVTKLLKSDDLKFVRDYIKNDRDNYRKALKGGRKQRGGAGEDEGTGERTGEGEHHGGAKKKKSKSSKKKSSKKKSSKKSAQCGGSIENSNSGNVEHHGGAKKKKSKSSKKKSSKKSKRNNSKKKSKNAEL